MRAFDSLCFMFSLNNTTRYIFHPVSRSHLRNAPAACADNDKVRLLPVMREEVPPRSHGVAVGLFVGAHMRRCTRICRTRLTVLRAPGRGSWQGVACWGGALAIRTGLRSSATHSSGSPAWLHFIACASPPFASLSTCASTCTAARLSHGLHRRYCEASPPPPGAGHHR
jgi:hypothetical protein